MFTSLGERKPVNPSPGFPAVSWHPRCAQGSAEGPPSHSRAVGAHRGRCVSGTRALAPGAAQPGQTHAVFLRPRPF